MTTLTAGQLDLLDARARLADSVVIAARRERDEAQARGDARYADYCGSVLAIRERAAEDLHRQLNAAKATRSSS